MPEQAARIPSPDHPITITPNPARVVVTLAGRTIADSRETLTLREANYPPVTYVPREHVDMALLSRSDHRTHCPYKGDASYYSIPLGGTRAVNAIWTYETPHAAVVEIGGYMAFYPDRVDSITTSDA
jgi:uncharacterized protein (DUF427 family)